MTLAVVRQDAPAGWSPRDEVVLIREQLAAIDAWNARRRSVEEAGVTTGASREARLDRSRRMDVIQRQHAAVLARTQEQLAASAVALNSMTLRRAVLVHRNEWFRGKVAKALAGRGVRVMTELDNGADAVGWVVAEQPDLLLVEDSLSMLSGVQVLHEAGRYAPGTLCAALVDHPDRVPVMVSAGARTVWTRQSPAQEVADGLGELVGV